MGGKKVRGPGRSLMNIYIYIYIYVCMYVCMYVHINTLIHTYRLQDGAALPTLYAEAVSEIGGAVISPFTVRSESEIVPHWYRPPLATSPSQPCIKQLPRYRRHTDHKVDREAGTKDTNRFLLCRLAHKEAHPKHSLHYLRARRADICNHHPHFPWRP